MKYLIYLEGDKQILIDETELALIRGSNTNFVFVGDKYINTSKIIYIRKLEDGEWIAKSAITKPPTPTELKAQEEANKEAMPVTLDEQIAAIK